MAYIDGDYLRDYGISDPRAESLILPACRIIDSYVLYPTNDDGFKFPREQGGVYGLVGDDGEVPDRVKMATAEQIRFMLDQGTDYINEGGDNVVAVNTLGASKVKATANNTPLLAPMAKHFLGGLLVRVGWM